MQHHLRLLQVVSSSFSRPPQDHTTPSQARGPSKKQAQSKSLLSWLPEMIRVSPKLNYDIRTMIWTLCYKTEPSRIVEIRTAKHNSCDEQDQFWCPRYSPSPPPAVVNICHEARQETQRVARISGHILFSDNQPSTSSTIYFDPEKDILYINNDKEHWIRDWYGGGGILTQLKHAWQPERLRILAIELDPIDRATSRDSFRDDLNYFQNLDRVIFVMAKPDERVDQLVRRFSDLPRQMRNELDSLRRLGRTIDQSGWMVTGMGFSHLYRGSQLKECSLAVRYGTRFEFVASYQCD